MIASYCSGDYSGCCSASTLSGIVVAPTMGVIGCCSGCFRASPVAEVIAAVGPIVAAVVLQQCQVL